MVFTIVLIIGTLTRETQWFRCCGGASRATCYIERLYWTADGSWIIKSKSGLSSEGGSSGAGWLTFICSNCEIFSLSFFIIFNWTLPWFCYQEFKLDQIRDQLQVILLPLISSIHWMYATRFGSAVIWQIFIQSALYTKCGHDLFLCN